MATLTTWGHVGPEGRFFGHGGPSLAMLATRKSPVVFVNIFMEGEVALAAAAEVLCPGSRRTNIM